MKSTHSMGSLLKEARFLLILSLVIFISGCSFLFPDNKRPEFPPTYPVDFKPPPKKDGTIYQSGYEISLYQDRIAHHVGDILTVRLEEQTQGAKKSKTKTDKLATNQFAVNQAFGANLTNGLSLDTSTNQNFDSQGESDQQNKLSGTVSVTVMQVLSNGSLVVRGESWLTINFGRELIQLSGIVREEDIEPDNSVSSQRVADARIVYSGNGQVADATRGGAITQLFFKYWPF